MSELHEYEELAAKQYAAEELLVRKNEMMCLGILHKEMQTPISGDVSAWYGLSVLCGYICGFDEIHIGEQSDERMPVPSSIYNSCRENVGVSPVPIQQGEFVRVHNKSLAVVLSHDVEDDTCNEHQQARDNKHDRADEGGEARYHAGLPEIHGYATAKNYSDDSENKAKPAEERERLVFANHAEYGRHDFDAVSHGVELTDGTFRAIAVLDRHLVKTQVVVQRVYGHLGLDLKTAREHGVGLDEGEREGAVAGHDIGNVRIEQTVDGATDQAVTKIMEWTLVLLEIRGTQSVTNHHVIAFKDFIHHSRSRISRISIVAIGHDVHVSIDILEHGSNHIALALAWLLTDDRTSIGCNLSRAVGGVVVIHVHVGVRQRFPEVVHYLTDGDFLVVAR